MRQKVVFIAGLARSGTTFVQLRLAQNGHLVALGEISQTINGMLESQAVREKYEWRDIARRTCSCGSSVDKCVFWGELKRQCLEIGDTQKLHNEVMSRSHELYGNRIVIDSSKDINALQRYYLDGKYDVKVIYVSRDFRGWVPSVQKHMKRLGLRNFGYLYDAYRWFWATVKHIRLLKKLGVDVFFLSYEKFVFDYDKEMEALEEYLNIGSATVSEERVAHDVWGSAFKNSPDSDSKLKYDYGWMASSKSAFLSFILFPVHLLNGYIYRKYN